MSNSEAPRCPLCLINNAQSSNPSNPNGLCASCKTAWDRAHASKATVGSLIDLVRTSGGSLFIDGVNYASAASQSPADFAAASKAINDALDMNSCVGQGRISLLSDIQNELDKDEIGSFAWFVEANAIPLTNPKRWPRISINITGCTAEVSISPQGRK